MFIISVSVSGRHAVAASTGQVLAATLDAVLDDLDRSMVDAKRAAVLGRFS